MPLKCIETSTHQTESLPYLPAMCMGSYLRFVVAPAFRLAYVNNDTVLAKVHTPDLRVVFNNVCNHRMLKEFLADESTLIISQWNERDRVTNRSLTGNASIPAAKSQSGTPACSPAPPSWPARL
jgi:hypothetical protein